MENVQMPYVYSGEYFLRRGSTDTGVLPIPVLCSSTFAPLEMVWTPPVPDSMEIA